MANGTAILVLNGPEFDEVQFTGTYSKEKYLVAVDGGISHLKRFDVIVDMHIGDMDSSGNGTPQNVASSWSFPADKDESDFDLALDHVSDQGYEKIEVFGSTGGRVDHFISNYETAVKYAGKGIDVIFRGVNENIHFLRVPGEFSFEPGTTVSVFSGTEKAEGVTLEGFKYPAENIELERSYPKGLSNIVISEKQSVSFSGGIIVIIENK